MTQQINLIDQTLRQGRDWANGVMVLGVLATATALVAGHFVYERLGWQKATAEAAQADAAREASAAIVQQVASQLDQVQAQLAADDQMRRAAAAMVDPPQNCVQRFEQLIAAMPATMWLEDVEFYGARGVHLVANSLHTADLARYADTLSSAKAFSGLPVEILSIERKEFADSDAPDVSAVKPKLAPYYAFELAGTENIEPAAGGTP